jgi:hypothetical protein
MKQYDPYYNFIETNNLKTQFFQKQADIDTLLDLFSFIKVGPVETSFISNRCT